MKNFILFLTIFAFIIEPMALMPKAQASAAQCRQGPQNTKKNCSDNAKLQQGMKNKDLGEKGQENKDVLEGSEQALNFMKLGQGFIQGAKAECTQAGEECMSACDQEIGRKRSMVPQQDTSSEEQAKQACKQEKEASEKKSEGSLKEIMALIQALMGLIASLKSKEEDKQDTETASAEEEDVCKTPEGAFLIDCQCEESEKTDGKCPIKRKNTASRLGGSTGIQAGLASANSLDPKPAAAEFESKLQEGGGVGAASVNSGLGGSPGGFGSGSTPSLAGGGGVDADKSVNADIHKGYHGGGGGGGGFGSFGGGGGAKSSSSGGYGSYGSDSSNKASAKKVLNKKLKSITASRRPASFNGGRTGGPFGDSFFTIQKAYKKQKSSMYHHNQQ